MNGVSQNSFAIQRSCNDVVPSFCPKGSDMKNINTEYEGYRKLLEKVDGNGKLKSVQNMFTNLSPAFGYQQQAQGTGSQKSQNYSSQFDRQTAQNGGWFKKNSQ